MWYPRIVFIAVLLERVFGSINYNADKNISDVAVALSEIIHGLHPRQLAILDLPQFFLKCNNTNDEENIHGHVDDFIYQLHKLNLKSVIFYDIEIFFKFIEANLLGSIESVNLIFWKPYELSARIQERRLSHRLSLFIFYWGAKHPPKAHQVHFEEPMRVVVITRPRKRAIYYNQAVPSGTSNLELVNWYDGDNLGLQKLPLLPVSSNVYADFKGRIFRVPVFHSPPWFWVNYDNDTSNSTFSEEAWSLTNYDTTEFEEYRRVNVTGGRDHRLMLLLANHMNFQFEYIEAPGRTQGSLRTDGAMNQSFTGGIGLLQNGLADFLLGDVSLSWERRKAVEFSFFTLADSGAFATHAPRRLNEAFAIIRPFKMDVWPYLILTIIFSGPIFYAIIALPFKWNYYRTTQRCQLDLVKKDTYILFHLGYIKELMIKSDERRKFMTLQHLLNTREARAEIPPNLFDRCIWFTVQLFLKQSCKELYHGYRAKFLMIVYWIAATYVLSDVYSAQLTSQFARPAHDAPINTLLRLQWAMLQDGYQLYVEKESSSLEMLENGTEIFRHLYALMKQQSCDEEGFVIDSVEAGIKLIADGFENKAVLGGRETLFFNIQQFGSQNFQLSQKLYTRYSAVAVQVGCPFLDSLNDVLIHLFESGIMDKMTTAEYEAQSRMIGKEINDQQNSVDSPSNPSSSDESGSSNNNNNDSNGKGAEHAEAQKQQDTHFIQPLNLRMLQGAFIVLACGYCSAGIILLFELMCHRARFNLVKVCQIRMRKFCCGWYRWFWKIMQIISIKIIR